MTNFNERDYLSICGVYAKITIAVIISFLLLTAVMSARDFII